MRKILLALSAVVLTCGAAEAQSDAPAVSAVKGGMMKAVRSSCRTDIKSLCSDVQPGGGRIAICIRSHESELSQPCRDAVAKFRQSRLSGEPGPAPAPAVAH